MRWLFEQFEAKQITRLLLRVLMILWMLRAVLLRVRNSMCLLTLSNFTRRSMCLWDFRAHLGQSGFAWSNPGFHRVILSRSWEAAQKYPKCCPASAHSPC